MERDTRRSRWRVGEEECQEASVIVKGKIYRMVARPAMFDGLETVALTERQEVELEAAELKMLRVEFGSDEDGRD